MWSTIKLSILLLLITTITSSYLQFQLIRMPYDEHKIQLQPITCKNQTAINQDAQYKEICYEKDVAYVMPFVRDGRTVALAADFTTPLSWMKGDDCAIEGSSEKCKSVLENMADKLKKIKQKVTSKFHKKASKTAQKQDAIIEGSSEVIRGQFEKSKNISFVSRNSNRLNNVFELIMLGLFIYGERDHLELESTNFISATSISGNLNRLMDGAISMRFDSTSENSFLNEIFTYVKATQKAITIYLGSNQTITIGDMTAKYTASGYSSINWIQTPDDQGFGKLAQVSDIGIEDRASDSDQDTDQTIPAVVTLSASYIGLPQFIIQQIIVKSFSKLGTCKWDTKTFYVECSSSNKKNIQKIIGKSLYFGFKGPKVMIPMSDLVLKNQHGKRVIFNIKKTFNNRVILGEPIFKQHVIIFDYSKDKIGIAPKRQNFQQFFVNVITLVRFLMVVFVTGCSFIICYQPCRKCMRAFRDRQILSKTGQQGRRLKQYSPIQQNPYEDLKGKIQDVITSTDRDVQGI